MKIWAHTIVMNEDRHVWYAVMSVINYIDKILIWDTGSKDNTVEIIKKIKKKFPEKVSFRQVSQKSVEHFTQIRQKMLESTKADWFIIVDADEVWWDGTIKYHTDLIRKRGKDLESVVCRYRNIVGDIYHYQEETAGRYSIDGVAGHLSIRAINRSIDGIHFAKPHGQQGIFDANGTLIQERDRQRRIFVDDISYLHFTNVSRSSDQKKDAAVPKRAKKLKSEIGHAFPRDFYYPEVFFRPRPSNVASVWEKMDNKFYLKSYFLTIPRKLKRRVIKGRSGY